MIFRRALASLTAATLMTAPVAAHAAPRQSAPVEGQELTGNPWIPIFVLVAVLAAILAVSASGNDRPTSP